MSEQYGCPDCNYVANIEDLPIQCPICGHTSMEHLRWTKGGAGSHWDGCVDVHWDCRIAQLEADNARLTALVERLKEDGERLMVDPIFEDEFHRSDYRCKYCRSKGKHIRSGLWVVHHAPDCPITLHRALMKELDEGVG